MNMNVHDSPLGKPTPASSDYDPALLFPIPRSRGRHGLGVEATLPFHGVDIWNAYELSWLDAHGKPRVAVGEFRIPAQSPNLIESKSFKLYLNSFNQSRHADVRALQELMVADLSAAADCPIEARVQLLGSLPMAQIESLKGECIDDVEVSISHFGPPQADLLRSASDNRTVEESLVSHLLKSNCPVTGQPDWASVQIIYAGRRIDRAGLLRYLVSYRNHDDFHEQCVERIFVDLLARCQPRQLTVSARYTRRGGLDINPWRSNVAGARAENPRLFRQ